MVLIKRSDRRVPTSHPRLKELLHSPKRFDFLLSHVYSRQLLTQVSSLTVFKVAMMGRTLLASRNLTYRSSTRLGKDLSPASGSLSMPNMLLSRKPRSDGPITPASPVRRSIMERLTRLRWVDFWMLWEKQDWWKATPLALFMSRASEQMVR